MAISKEQQFILDTVRDFVQEKSSKKSDVDWGAVIKLARAHQIETILFYQHKDNIPEKHFANLKKTYYAHLSSILDRREALDKIDNALNDKGIDYLIFKGFEIMQYYPKPELRTMGDCDILVRQKSLEAAEDALSDAGFENRGSYYESIFAYKNLMFELHGQLLYDEIVNSDDDIEFCNQAWNHATKIEDNKYQLDNNFHFIYLLLHLKKHLYVRGAGLRLFVDIFLFANKANLDNEKVDKMLRELDLQKFYHVCTSLCKRWFQNNDDGFVSNDFYENATIQILESGAFGFQNSDKENLANFNREKKFGKIGSKVQYVFPGYKDLCRVKTYAFIKGKPYLLPAAWAYRFFRLLTNKNVHINKNHLDSGLTKEQVKKLEDNFKSWGI